MITLLVYNKYDGRIDRTVSCPSEWVEKQVGPNEVWFLIEGKQSSVKDSTHYVDTNGTTPLLKAKRDFDTTHVIEGVLITLFHIPAGANVSVGAIEIEADGNVTEIEFELPGTYTINLTGLVEYLDEELEVTING